MSSVEIAGLVEKRHDHVMRDIRNMLVELHGEEGVPKFGDTYTNPQNKQSYPIYNLPKRETFILVSGYNIKLRAKIVDRWEELENRASNPIANLTRIDLIKLALHSEEERLALEEKNKELTADSEALSRIAKAEGSLCITDAAKSLQIRPKNLFMWLRSHKWIYKRVGCAHDCAYQDKQIQGLLEHKVTTVLRSDGSEKITEQARITPKGLEKLSKLISLDFQRVA